MSEQPDITVRESDCYREIIPTGQITNLGYDGLRLTVLHDSFNLQDAVKGNQIKVSKATINRNIECTIILTPVQLKTWAIIFNDELQKYEKFFGIIMSPEEIQEKFKNQPK